jgi:hypothetical protein
LTFERLRHLRARTYFDTIFNPYTPYLRDYSRTDGTRELQFRKGRNRIFFKLANGPIDAFVSRVLAREGPGRPRREGTIVSQP